MSRLILFICCLMNPTVSETTGDYDPCALSIVVRTARELQRELLIHYAGKSETPDPAICFYLGLNYMSENLVCRQEDRNWKLATKWLQKAAKSRTYEQRANTNLEGIRKCQEESTLALKPTSFGGATARRARF